MTREEAINLLGWLKSKTNRDDDLEAIDIAIETLQNEETLKTQLANCHKEILRLLDFNDTTESQNDAIESQNDVIEVVRCKDCIHQEHCHETVAHTRHHADFIEYWSETIEWCSRGERKGGDS